VVEEEESEGKWIEGRGERRMGERGEGPTAEEEK